MPSEPSRSQPAAMPNPRRRPAYHPAPAPEEPYTPSKLTDCLQEHGDHRHFPAKGSTIQCIMHRRSHTEKLKGGGDKVVEDTWWMSSPQLPHTYARTKTHNASEYREGKQVKCKVLGYATDRGGLYTTSPACIVEVL
jgi:hypothetical protein